VNMRIDVDVIEKYILSRQGIISKKIVTPKLDEEATELLRGRFAELIELRKALESNLAIPEGRNE